MLATQHWMEVTANNLANASTNGYKRDVLMFNDAFDQALKANGGVGASIGSSGAGLMKFKEFTSFERGSITNSNNPLDLAITSDRGLFAVQSPQGVRYTRDGSFTLDEQNRVVTKAGYPVLDDQQKEITLSGNGKIEVGADGSISLNGKAEGKRIGVFDGTFSKEGNNLFTSSDAAAPPQGQEILIKAGAIETSNVNPVDAMITMITIGRNYEMAQKSMQQQDELTQRLIQSLNEK